MSHPTDPKVQTAVSTVQERFESRIKEITDDGNKKLDEITEDAPQPNGVEAAVKMTFDVKMKTTSIKIDVPKFSTELQKIKMDIPTVTMKTKAISWDVPATKMERRCIAKKPVMTCRGFKCTVKQECIYMDFPVVYSKRMEIKTDIPEITMTTKELSFHKPVVSLETVEIKLDLPQFHFRDLEGDLQQQEDEANEVANDMNARIAVAKREMDDELLVAVGDEVEDVFEAVRKKLLEERSAISTQFEIGINKLKSAIKTLKENNATAEVAKLETELSALVKEYTTVVTELDASLKKVNDEQAAAIKNIRLQ